jgi:hypothetical protein
MVPEGIKASEVLGFVLLHESHAQRFEQSAPALPYVRPTPLIGLITIELCAVWRDSMDACLLSP